MQKNNEDDLVLNCMHSTVQAIMLENEQKQERGSRTDFLRLPGNVVTYSCYKNALL